MSRLAALCCCCCCCCCCLLVLSSSPAPVWCGVPAASLLESAKCLGGRCAVVVADDLDLDLDLLGLVQAAGRSVQLRQV